MRVRGSLISSGFRFSFTSGLLTTQTGTSAVPNGTSGENGSRWYTLMVIRSARSNIGKRMPLFHFGDTVPRCTSVVALRPFMVTWQNALVLESPRVPDDSSIAPCTIRNKLPIVRFASLNTSSDDVLRSPFACTQPDAAFEIRCIHWFRSTVWLARKCSWFAPLGLPFCDVRLRVRQQSWIAALANSQPSATLISLRKYG